MRFYEESEKVGLKLNIQKSKIMASGPVTSWEIDGETVETVSEFILVKNWTSVLLLWIYLLIELSIQKTKIMASGPVTSWQIDGKQWKIVRDFIWVGSKITVDGDYNHEMKRRLLLGRKVMT